MGERLDDEDERNSPADWTAAAGPALGNSLKLSADALSGERTAALASRRQARHTMKHEGVQHARAQVPRTAQVASDVHKRGEAREVEGSTAEAVDPNGLAKPRGGG